MASDSRLTLNVTQQKGDKQVVQVAVGQSDSNYKTFLGPNNIGISTYGAADVEGIPIAGYIESFVNEHLAQGNYTVDQVPQEVIDYFGKLPGPPASGFLIAGYKTVNNVAEQYVWQAVVKTGNVVRLNEGGAPGASWRGESDIVRRLVKPVGVRQESGDYSPVPSYQIQWRYFTLQDAIDYAMYAVRTTIDTMRFQPRPKTVGGPIDILVIKPYEAFWVQRKTLQV